MERKGIYRKGRAGHARNVASYRLYRQNFKKWRIPMTALVALALVFATAPTVGDEFKASLLTADETAKLSRQPVEESKKVLLNALQSFLGQCKKYHIDLCVEQGKTLSTEMVSFGNDVTHAAAFFENFAARFEKDVAKAACKDVVGALVAQQVHDEDALDNFVELYGDVLNADSLFEARISLSHTSSVLEEVVEICEKG